VISDKYVTVQRNNNFVKYPHTLKLLLIKVGNKVEAPKTNQLRHALHMGYMILYFESFPLLAIKH
jgi:hypothetical protein